MTFGFETSHIRPRSYRYEENNQSSQVLTILLDLIGHDRLISIENARQIVQSRVITVDTEYYPNTINKKGLPKKKLLKDISKTEPKGYIMINGEKLEPVRNRFYLALRKNTNSSTSYKKCRSTIGYYHTLVFEIINDHLQLFNDYPNTKNGTKAYLVFVQEPFLNVCVDGKYMPAEQAGQIISIENQSQSVFDMTRPIESIPFVDDMSVEEIISRSNSSRYEEMFKQGYLSIPEELLEQDLTHAHAHAHAHAYAHPPSHNVDVDTMMMNDTLLGGNFGGYKTQYFPETNNQYEQPTEFNDPFEERAEINDMLFNYDADSFYRSYTDNQEQQFQTPLHITTESMDFSNRLITPEQAQKLDLHGKMIFQMFSSISSICEQDRSSMIREIR